MTIESIDTNILLRLVLNDVPEQCRKVEALIRDDDRRFRIADPALTEMVFVLEKIYQLDRPEIAELMDILSSIPQFLFDRPLFEATTQLYLDKPALSIVDCYLAATAAARDANPLWTFDKKLARQCSNARELI